MAAPEGCWPRSHHPATGTGGARPLRPLSPDRGSSRNKARKKKSVKSSHINCVLVMPCLRRSPPYRRGTRKSGSDAVAATSLVRSSQQPSVGLHSLVSSLVTRVSTSEGNRQTNKLVVFIDHRASYIHSLGLRHVDGCRVKTKKRNPTKKPQQTNTKTTHSWYPKKDFSLPTTPENGRNMKPVKGATTACSH